MNELNFNPDKTPIEIIMLNLMIILYHLKLDKFYCIGAMNWLKVICYNCFNFLKT